MLNCKPVLHSRGDVFGKTVAKMCQLTCLGGEDRKMGKKQGRKREREEEEDEEGQEIDLELEAELAALQQIQHEKEENDNEDSDEDEEGIETGTKKTNYNKEGLVHCNESLGVTHLPFIETMSICEYELHVEDENDDLEREMAFYNHAIQAVNIGRMRFADLKIPFRRPDDYFCESLKSDAHMARIKDRLIIEEKRIDAFEKRKQRELNRKYNKQVSALRKSEKSQQVKSEINSSKSEFRGRGDDAKGGVAGRGGGDKGARPEKSFKRQAMDKKYGFGGKDKMKSKLSDQKSLNDFSQYNPRGGKLVRREKKTAGGRGGGGGRVGAGRGGGGAKIGRSGGGGAKAGAGNRPGKRARTERRASRSQSA